MGAVFEDLLSVHRSTPRYPRPARIVGSVRRRRSSARSEHAGAGAADRNDLVDAVAAVVSRELCGGAACPSRKAGG